MGRLQVGPITRIHVCAHIFRFFFLATCRTPIQGFVSCSDRLSISRFATCGTAPSHRASRDVSATQVERVCAALLQFCSQSVMREGCTATPLKTALPFPASAGRLMPVRQTHDAPHGQVSPRAARHPSPDRADPPHSHVVSTSATPSISQSPSAYQHEHTAYRTGHTHARTRTVFLIAVPCSPLRLYVYIFLFPSRIIYSYLQTRVILTFSSHLASPCSTFVSF